VCEAGHFCLLGRSPGGRHKRFFRGEIREKLKKETLTGENKFSKECQDRPDEERRQTSVREIFGREKEKKERNDEGVSSP